MPSVHGFWIDEPADVRRRAADNDRAMAGLYAQYRDLFELVEREAPRPAILLPRGRNVVSPADAGEEMRWHGDAYVQVTPGPTRTRADAGTVAARYDELLEQLYEPIDPRAWATTPPPCEPPPLPVVEPVAWDPPLVEAEVLQPGPWSRPLWMWP